MKQFSFSNYNFNITFLSSLVIEAFVSIPYLLLKIVFVRKCPSRSFKYGYKSACSWMGPNAYVIMFPFFRFVSPSAYRDDQLYRRSIVEDTALVVQLVRPMDRPFLLRTREMRVFPHPAELNDLLLLRIWGYEEGVGVEVLLYMMFSSHLSNYKLLKERGGQL